MINHHRQHGQKGTVHLSLREVSIHILCANNKLCPFCLLMSLIWKTAKGGGTKGHMLPPSPLSRDPLWHMLPPPPLSRDPLWHRNKYHNTVTEGLSAVTSLSLHLPWTKFKKLLHKSLKELTTNLEDKIMVKVVGAILAGNSYQMNVFFVNLYIQVHYLFFISDMF